MAEDGSWAESVAVAVQGCQRAIWRLGCTPPRLLTQYRFLGELLQLSQAPEKTGEAQDLEKHQPVVSLCLSVDKVRLPEIRRLAEPLTWVGGWYC